MIPVLVFLLITGLVGGGASVAAESSLPGDLLYPIKVGINEKVGEVLAFSTEAKADFDAKIAVRRLQEAESLSVKGKINPDTISRLESNFKVYADRVASRIADLNANGKLDTALEVNSNFESSLNAHKDILARLAAQDKDESDKTQLQELSARVSDTALVAVTIGAEIESKLKTGAAVNVQAAVEGKLKAAQNKVDEARKFLDANESSVSAEVYAKAEANLTSANGAIAQGKIKVEAKAYGEAFVFFQRAIRLASEAQQTVNGNSELNLEIKANLNIGGGAKTEENPENKPREKSGSESSGVKADASIEVNGNAETKSGNSGTGAEGGVNVKLGL